MIISYFGKQFVKISQGDLTLAFNPLSHDSDHKDKISRFGADVALITANHPDFNGVDTVTHGSTIPFVISGPGDYETREIFIKGLMTETEIPARSAGGDKKKYINTIYFLTVDEIKICFLGSLFKDIGSEAREAIAGADILFVPIGGEGVLSPKEAYKLSVSLEPKIIIPMDYGADRMKDALKIFLKEGGAEKTEPLEKLTLKRKDLENKEGDIIVLKS
ncbi:MAG TPA: MBL fold metallo-hydrolase [Candidatus Paceibacterota bacterium]